MAEWYAVIEVAWGPAGAFRQLHYAELESLEQLPKAVRKAVEETELEIPEGTTVVGAVKITLYRTLSELCEDYDDLDPCETNE